MEERDLCDVVREYEENGGDTRWEVDTCDNCGHHFLVVSVAPRLAEMSLCSWRCWAELHGEP